MTLIALLTDETYSMPSTTSKPLCELEHFRIYTSSDIKMTPFHINVYNIL